MRGWTKERQRALYQRYILLMQLEALAFLQWQAPKAMRFSCAPSSPSSSAARCSAAH
jgi:hypothetical protein